MAQDLTPSDKTDRFGQIHEMFEKAKVYSDDKVQLAMQTYEMVDKHIRRLDTELAKFESDIKEKQINATSTTTAPPEENKKKGRSGARAGKGKTVFNPKSVIKENEKSRKKQDNKSNKIEIASVPTPPSTAVLPSLVAGSNEVLDMPVDPNEPTYCLCHQVSYGEMIGCDNQDCPIEWFHFGCVGLTSKPKGKWFCPKCAVDRKKK